MDARSSYNCSSTLSAAFCALLILIGYILFCAGAGRAAPSSTTAPSTRHVYCNEHGLPSPPKTRSSSPRCIPRCGTSFLLIVFVISIVLVYPGGLSGRKPLPSCALAAGLLAAPSWPASAMRRSRPWPTAKAAWPASCAGPACRCSAHHPSAHQRNAGGGHRFHERGASRPRPRCETTPKATPSSETPRGRSHLHAARRGREADTPPPTSLLNPPRSRPPEAGQPAAEAE